MESTKNRLIDVRESMETEEWKNIKIYMHTYADGVGYTLIGTKLSDSLVYSYDLEAEEFRPLSELRSLIPK